MSVIRIVDASGTVSFAGAGYRVGRSWARRNVEVAIVGGSVQISADSKVIRVHQIRHDRSKEYGAFAMPKGNPAGPRSPRGFDVSGRYRSQSVVRVPGLDIRSSLVRGSKTEVSPGVWRLRVYTGNRRANGSPVLLSKTVKSTERKPGAGARLADRELAKMVTEADRGNLLARDVTVNQLFDEWLAHLEIIGRSHTTVREYRRLAERVVGPDLGHIRLTKLTSRDLDRLYERQMAREIKPISVRRIHAVMHAALRQAKKWKLVSANVADDATPPDFHVDPVKAPSSEQVRAILVEAEKLDPTLAALLMLAALTGARRGELCALRWSDLGWESATLTIARSVYEIRGGGWAEKPTKTHQTRRIGLDDLGMTVLRRHRSDVEGLAASLALTVRADAFMFSRSPIGSEPVRPNAVTQFSVKLAEVTGIDFHLHGLRHFSATQAIAGGYDAVTAAARLGHGIPRSPCGCIHTRSSNVTANLRLRWGGHWLYPPPHGHEAGVSGLQVILRGELQVPSHPPFSV